jgi:hypothetical protein
MTEFMGKPLSYWVELQKKAETLNATDLITDIAKLSAKVRYYEEKLDEMIKFKTITNSLKVP